ncbi:Crp/Fnr family transcriptional regulator [Marivita hallyeonensis]|uniref:Popeye protein conserved region n=1 Tax=Marivita hallyeonensis TaxID=996342 RepID=A0A1M5P815_9RHOB|nr:cyclic nucleotide-binding domain-containing protein [Marivita hallyeonensis]SHG97954.1 Popeye protein conserved region [Marivita hallyeonensis]
MDPSQFFSAEFFVHVALFFYVWGLLARNELWLRLLILAGTFCYIVYYYYVSEAPLWDAIWASSVIGVTNLFMIGVILHERSTLGMNATMLALYASFPTLNPGQFRRIMKHADWVTAEAETRICTRGVRPDSLYLVSAGQMHLFRDGTDAWIGPGNFIGEISFLIDGPATADVIAQKGTEYVRWDRAKLKALMDKSPRISNAISALFNKDIARKLSVSTPVPEQAGQATGTLN